MSFLLKIRVLNGWVTRGGGIMYDWRILVWDYLAPENDLRNKVVVPVLFFFICMYHTKVYLYAIAMSDEYM